MHKIYYSPSTKGFYDSNIHGERKIEAAVAGWARPHITLTLEPGKSALDGQGLPLTNTGAEPLTIDTLDWTAQAPTREIDNPDCTIPADALEITPEFHAELLAAQGQGKAILCGADGLPYAGEQPELPFAEASALALKMMKAERTPIITILDGLQSTALTKGEQSKALAIENCKQGLRDAGTAVPLTQGMKFEDMRQAFKAYYASLVAGAAPEVVTAFREVA